VSRFFTGLRFEYFGSICKSGEAAVNGSCNALGLPIVGAGSSVFQTALQIVFGVLAALAILFIVLGGLRLVMAQGDPQGVTKARNTILYAVIGLAIAISAEVIVAFVLGKL